MSQRSYQPSFSFLFDDPLLQSRPGQRMNGEIQIAD
jgi:hypothetical protein